MERRTRQQSPDNVSAKLVNIVSGNDLQGGEYFRDIMSCKITTKLIFGLMGCLFESHLKNVIEVLFVKVSKGDLLSKELDIDGSLDVAVACSLPLSEL